ncbi:hypothetical protein CEXT_556551 [Caerostris extrusa]|uniref:VWFA domain-containing protein n=1 Tax=Caerostris extrusa TaxID=172846 RepID=A0AAV4S8I3_CAEEX|nr:hypothetical protein CEXT_556551 [Caerostris extrusa]
MRTYPASQWITIPRKPNFPDLYDVRLRNWYVHASTSPKDMLILMDTSGSMHGQTMEIMKIAVKTLLTTLFNSSAKWISCFDTLCKLIVETSRFCLKAIDSIEDGNMAKLSIGLTLLSKLLSKENRSNSWAGSQCNQVIMLFSDGGTEEAWDVLEKYNSDKSVRVFAYAIGPHPVPYATLKEIACSNRGYFTSIQAMGAVRTKIQGLGMMTTVTLPVFNRTEIANQSMVGVMKIDISLQKMLDFEPSYEMGPAGYSFGINQNGYVVLHPDLKTEFEYTDDPPHLDFLDVEIENPAKIEKHIVRHHMEYYYTPLNKTSFSIAIVMPTDRTHYLHVEETDFVLGFDLSKSEMKGMHIAPWKYCHGKVLKLGTPDIIKNLSHTVRTNPDSCKTQLLRRLVWDIRKTNDIMHYWQSEEQDGRSESHHLEGHTNPSRSILFQRAFYGDDFVFIPPENKYDPAINQTESDAVITIVKTISFARSGITYKPAVVGVMVDPLWLQPYLLSTPSGPGKVPVSCSDVDYIVCYLIDDGGFIISTNQPDLWAVLGKFLGYVDSEIMTELYEKWIYVRNEDFNYEDRCKKRRKSVLVSGPLPYPSTPISAFKIGWLFDITAWSQIKYWLFRHYSLAKVGHMNALLLVTENLVHLCFVMLFLHCCRRKKKVFKS